MRDPYAPYDEYPADEDQQEEYAPEEYAPEEYPQEEYAAEEYPEQTYHDPYAAQENPAYEATGQFRRTRRGDDQGVEIVSTSQAINLTCTLASLSGLLALFLCFADLRSRAVRRISVQSVGLLVCHVALGLVCWLFSALLGWVPLVGYLLYILCLALFWGLTAFVLVLRVRMMLHAYRGEAFALPVIGQYLRKYE